MADDFQQLPIISTTSVLQVNAANPDAGSSGDGYLREHSGRKPSKKPAAKKPPAPSEPQPTINPSVLLHDEVTLTRSARTLMGEYHPPPPAPIEIPPEENTPFPTPATSATPQHIHITA